MHLIVVVIAILAERTLSQLPRWRDTDGFERYIGLIERSRFGRAWLSRPLGVLVIAPPLAALATIQWTLAAQLWLGLELIFGVVVLLLSFGPRDLWEDTYALAHARSEADYADVRARAVGLARRATGGAPRDITAETVLGAVFVQGHERVLAVVVWYAIAGPTGAMFYRLVRELSALASRGTGSPALERTADYVHGSAAWLPARLIVLLYALIGRTFAGLAAARRAHCAHGLSASSSWQLLAYTGRGALGLAQAPDSTRYDARFNETLIEALGLLSRTLLILLSLLAVLTIFGWLS